MYWIGATSAPKRRPSAAGPPHQLRRHGRSPCPDRLEHARSRSRRVARPPRLVRRGPPPSARSCTRSTARRWARPGRQVRRLARACREPVGAASRAHSTGGGADEHLGAGSDLAASTRPAGSWHPLPQEFFHVLGDALEVAQASGGAFDPCAGPLVELWGFGPRGFIATPTSRRRTPMPLQRARRSAAGNAYRLDPPESRAQQPAACRSTCRHRQGLRRRSRRAALRGARHRRLPGRGRRRAARRRHQARRPALVGALEPPAEAMPALGIAADTGRAARPRDRHLGRRPALFRHEGGASPTPSTRAPAGPRRTTLPR